MSPGGPHSPLDRWNGCFGTPAGGGSFLGSSIQCALQDVARRTRDATAWPGIMQGSRGLQPEFQRTAVLVVVRGTGGNLILQPAQALALAQHRQHVEDRRGCGAARQCCAQRLGDAAELDPFALGKGADRLFGRLGAPGLDRCPGLPRRRASRWRASAVSRPLAFSSRASGRLATMNRAPSTSSTRVLARSFKPGHGREQLHARLRRQLGGELGSAGDVREHALDLVQEIGIGRLAHVVAVEALKLGKVEAGGRTSDLR